MASDRFVPSRTATPTGTSGSMTTTSTQAGPSVPIDGSGPTLRLRAESDAGQARHIQWAEDVIDNEGMGKKSSKVCCIYHKPKNAGDSSSDESSSDSDSSDSEPDLSRAQPARRPARRQHSHDHNGEDHDAGDGPDPEMKDKGKGKLRDTSPNAYERVPRRKKDKT
ncbi:hypothetical protein KVT40_003424 [Elsinoe batatas]|uniref:Type 1 phosphatases regulator n=1 Tax=Elsinoe batatas TaxID=2601811 RepID=A0A8K0L6U5_9PEZI|nr:hypothetical protein KVT40_003424 [Elsinoe batatas]